MAGPIRRRRRTSSCCSRPVFHFLLLSFKTRLLILFLLLRHCTCCLDVRMLPPPKPIDNETPGILFSSMASVRSNLEQLAGRRIGVYCRTQEREREREREERDRQGQREVDNIAERKRKRKTCYLVFPAALYSAERNFGGSKRVHISNKTQTVPLDNPNPRKLFPFLLI